MSSCCRVYIGNLSWKVKWQDLKDHMKQAGEVLRADVFEDFQGRSKGCGIVEYSLPEEAQRAIKELNDSELFERLIFVREDREDNNGPRANNLRGRGGYPPYRGRGDFSGPRGRGGAGGFGGDRGPGDRGPGDRSYGDRGYDRGYGDRGGGGGNGRQVFITNLPWRTSWQDLKDLFRECGEVARADVMTMPDGRSKGVGTIMFTSEEGAQKAVQNLNNFEMDGRRITVKIDRQ